MAHAARPVIDPQTVAASQGTLEAVIGLRTPAADGPWINQYAQHVADAGNRVVLAQLQENRCDLRLFEGAAGAVKSPRAASSGGSAGSGGVDSDPRTFFKSIRESDESVDRWMVRINVAGAVTTLPALSAIDRWTIVTNLNEHTSLRLYALVKELRRGEKFKLFRAIGVFVIGSQLRHAAQCVSSTNLLTTRLLRSPLHLAGHAEKPPVIRSSVIGGFELVPRKWPQVITRLRQLSGPRGKAQRAPLRLVGAAETAEVAR